jgi:2,5-dichloro-2,5-cyclohexadiene-1,4-diol dehydrogenase 1
MVDTTESGLGGRSYIVTGAGSGIGRATAILLAHAGASVTVADTNVESLEQTVATISESGGKSVLVQADISDEGDVEKMVETAVHQFGQLDGAFNNAGISGAGDWGFGTPIRTSDANDWRRIIDTNLTGTFLCIKHQLRAIRAEATSSIVVNASAAGLVGAPGVAAYSASKHALVGLVKCSALEVASTGIRVNAVCPAYTATPMVLGVHSEETLRQRTDTVPLRRLADPNEIGAAVLWLLSDASRFVTGTAMPIDGGLTAG